MDIKNIRELKKAIKGRRVKFEVVAGIWATITHKEAAYVIARVLANNCPVKVDNETIPDVSYVEFPYR